MATTTTMPIINRANIRASIISSSSSSLSLSHASSNPSTMKKRKMAEARMFAKNGSAEESGGTDVGDIGADDYDRRKSKQTHEGKKAIVIGAGPAGALSALALARAGFSVDCFERRGPSSRLASGGHNQLTQIRNLQGVGNTRQYNVVLNGRGIAALEMYGVKVSANDCVKLAGSVRHEQKGFKRPLRNPFFFWNVSKRTKIGEVTSRSTNAFSGSISIDRGVLAAEIQRAASEQFPEQITFHFNKQCMDVQTGTSIDLQSKKVVIERFEGELTCPFLSEDEECNQTYKYDLLVGCDGVNSEVRKAMEIFDSGSFTVKKHIDGMQYKSVSLPVVGGLIGADVAEQWKKSFHTWPRGQNSLLAPPNPDGTLSGVVILPSKSINRKAKWSWDSITAPQEVQAMFSELFPNAFGGLLPPAVSTSLANQKAAPGGTTIFCSSLSIPKRHVVLVGDSAHAVWPSLGQGANVALESAACLGIALEEIEDIRKGLETFDKLRKPQTDACGRLSMGGFGNTTSRTTSSFLFVLRVTTLIILNKLIPAKTFGIFGFQPPAIFQLGNPDFMYLEIENRIREEVMRLSLMVGSFVVLLMLCIKFGGANAFVRHCFGL
jgi:kynurenine 3-monooxygenase